MRCFLVATCSLALLLGVNPRSVHADGDKPGDISEILKAKDFWDKAGKKDGRKWTDAEKKQLDDFKSTSKDAVIRLRANKVLVDLAGNARFGGAKDDEAVVIGCFRHLEKELATLPVKTLCTQQGFTHYGDGGGSNVLLIEHVQPGGFNGGLNLKWDSEKKAVVEMKSWGDVPAK